MAKWLFKILGGLIAAVILIGAVGIGVLWFSPKTVVKLADGLLPESVTIQLDELAGSPLHGYRFKNLFLETKFATIRVLEGEISWTPAGLIEQPRSLKRILLVKPTVNQKPAPDRNPSQKEPSENSNAIRIPFIAESIEVRQGQFSPIETIQTQWGNVTNINISGGVNSPNHFDLQQFHFEALKSSFTLNGTAQWQPTLELNFSGNVTGAAKGPIHLSYSPTGIQLKTQLAAEIKEMKLSTQPYSGSLNLSAMAAGPPDQIDWSIETSILNLRLASMTIQAAQLSAQGQGIPIQNGHVKFTANNLQAGPTDIKEISAIIKGSTASHTLSIQLNGQEASLMARANGTLKNGEWKATWNQFTINHKARWDIKSPFFTRVQPPEFEIHNFTIQSNTASIHLDGRLNHREWNPFQFSISNLDLSLLKEWELTNLELEGILFSSGTISGPLINPQGSINLNLENLGFKKTELGNVVAIGSIQSSFFQIDSLTISSDYGQLSAAAKIPLRPKKGDPFDFEAELRTNGFNPSPFIQAFTNTDVGEMNLIANVKIKREKGSFSAQGPATLTAERIKIPPAGLDLTQVNLDIMGKGQRLEIITATANTQKDGKLSVSGSFSKKGPDLLLKANHAALQIPIGLWGEIDGEIKLKNSWEAPFVTGKMEIIHADYNPDKKIEDPNEKNSSPDSDNPGPLKLDVEVNFDRNLWYKKGQTAIELTGTISVRKDSYRPPQIFGSISVVRGSYVLYGREFNINTGKVDFVGKSPPDPLLNIRAEYVDRNSKFRVYLDVDGTAKAPEIHLRSEPPLSEGDIVSVLVTGQPLNELEGAGGSSGKQMAQNLVAGYLSEEIRQELQDTVGLDIFRVSVEDSEVRDIVVGKNITQDLHVAYGQTLGPEGQKRVEAEYYLSKIWMLEGYTTSQGQYVIDLLFKFGFE